MPEPANDRTANTFEAGNPETIRRQSGSFPAGQTPLVSPADDVIELLDPVPATVPGAISLPVPLPSGSGLSSLASPVAVPQVRIEAPAEQPKMSQNSLRLSAFSEVSSPIITSGLGIQLPEPEHKSDGQKAIKLGQTVSRESDLPPAPPVAGDNSELSSAVKLLLDAPAPQPLFPAAELASAPVTSLTALTSALPTTQMLPVYRPSRRFEIRLTALHIDGSEMTSLEQAGVHSSNLLLTGTSHQALVDQTLDRAGRKSTANQVHSDLQTVSLGEKGLFAIGHLCQHCNEVDGVGSSDVLLIVPTETTGDGVTFTAAGRSRTSHNTLTSLATMVFTVSSKELADGYTTLIAEVPQEGTIEDDAAKAGPRFSIFGGSRKQAVAEQFVQRVSVVTIREVAPVQELTVRPIESAVARPTDAVSSSGIVLREPARLIVPDLILPAPTGQTVSAGALEGSVRDSSNVITPVTFAVVSDEPGLLSNDGSLQPVLLPPPAPSSKTPAGSTDSTKPRFPAVLATNPDVPRDQTAPERRTIGQQLKGLFSRNQNAAADSKNRAATDSTPASSDSSPRKSMSFGAASRR